VFVRNNLHIDEIIICEDGSSCVTAHSEWMLKNHHDTTTKITIFRGPTTDFRRIIHYDDIASDGTINDDWIFQNKSDLFKFSPVGSAPFFDIYAAQHYSGHKYAVVIGYEKPGVYFQDGHWYTRQSDIILSSILGRPHLESFFLNPLLNLKQSHLTKRFMKRLNAVESEKLQAFGKIHRRLFDRPRIDYQVQAKMCGRHNELFLGYSETQKIQNYQGYKSIVVDTQTAGLDFAKGEQYLRDAVAGQNSLATNFLKGMYNLMSEPGFVEFLNQNILTAPNSILLPRAIWSKPYNLGN